MSVPPVRFHSEVHSRLRTRRMSAGLTQQELADKAGVSRKTVHAIESRKRWPSVLVALKLAAALGINIEALFSLGKTPR